MNPSDWKFEYGKLFYKGFAIVQLNNDNGIFLIAKANENSSFGGYYFQRNFNDYREGASWMKFDLIDRNKDTKEKEAKKLELVGKIAKLKCELDKAEKELCNL